MSQSSMTMRAVVMKRMLPVVLGLAACVAPAADQPAPASSDFVRFREDSKGAQLQTAIATYRNAAGVVVELIGAIHIADAAYYAKLNQRFTKCDRVLYEMVGEELEAVEDEAKLPPRKSGKADGGRASSSSPPPKAATPAPEQRAKAIEEFLSKNSPDKPAPRRAVTPKAPPPEEAAAEEAAHEHLRWLHPLYGTLKNTLKLESQLAGIDYTRTNFVHADMTARQFAAMQDQRGEGFLQIWWRAMQAQMAHPEASPESPGLLKILEILCRPDSPTELKRLMGRMFDQVERIMAGMETEQGSVIVVERNKVALGVLQREMAKGHKHLGIFYGAAHLVDMEQRLMAMGFKKEKTEWLTAWDLPPEPPPVKPAPQMNNAQRPPAKSASPPTQRKTN